MGTFTNTYGTQNTRQFWTKRGPKLKKAFEESLLFLILVYRVFLSAIFGGNCRFEPSCSAYAGEAIKKHGPGHGLGMAVRRMCRCHPFAKGGLDPVPPQYTELQ